MSMLNHCLLGGLVVHQQKYRPSDRNKKVHIFSVHNIITIKR